MSFNVQDILSNLNKTGVAKVSHYEVQITSPNGLNSTYPRDMMLRAISAEIPGRNIQTIDNHKFNNYGPGNNVPYAAMYMPITLTFLASQDLREKIYFDGWQQLMVDTDAFTPEGTPYNKFNTKYFDDYIGTILIRQFDETGTVRTEYKMVEAYPTIINPISMSWGDDDLVRLNVQFAYRYYKVTHDIGNNKSSF